MLFISTKTGDGKPALTGPEVVDQAGCYIPVKDPTSRLIVTKDKQFFYFTSDGGLEPLKGRLDKSNKYILYPNPFVVRFSNIF
jgi:hypothetical protein